MSDGPFIAGGMRDERKFKVGMWDCKASGRSRKLVIFMAGRGNSCLFRAENGMVDSEWVDKGPCEHCHFFSNLHEKYFSREVATS